MNAIFELNRVDDESSIEKREIRTHINILEIKYFVHATASLLKTLLSRNFCHKDIEVRS